MSENYHQYKYASLVEFADRCDSDSLGLQDLCLLADETISMASEKTASHNSEDEAERIAAATAISLDILKTASDLLNSGLYEDEGHLIEDVFMKVAKAAKDEHENQSHLQRAMNYAKQNPGRTAAGVAATALTAAGAKKGGTAALNAAKGTESWKDIQRAGRSARNVMNSTKASLGTIGKGLRSSLGINATNAVKGQAARAATSAGQSQGKIDAAKGFLTDHFNAGRASTASQDVELTEEHIDMAFGILKTAGYMNDEIIGALTSED